MRYLGPAKRSGGKAPVDEGRARKEMGQIGQILGRPAAPLPEHLKSLLREAQRVVDTHKGL